ncbi:MAG: integrase, partial [Anaerolineae bacterium]
VHSDNGSEFINMPLVAYFGEELVGTAQTRGRPGHHNDNRFVEQKNSSLVRAYLGTLPLHTHAQLRALNALYEDMWLYYNFSQPVLRQTARTAVTGADGVIRIRRQQDRARTPYERLVRAKPVLSQQTHERLQAL